LCHAILRVKFVGQQTAQIIEVDSERDLQKRISELCDKEQIVAIQIFPRQQDMVLTKEWKTLTYEPPAQAFPA
jgi:hypothetical protein